MIPKQAVQEYLEAKRDDHRWVKRCTHKQLDAALAAMDPKPQLSPELRLHQKASFMLGVAHPRFSQWLDMGAGKTLLTLELLRYWKQAYKCRRALIFLTSDKALPTWEKQMERFGIEIPYCDITEGDSKTKWRKLGGFGQGLVFVTYPGALAMVCRRARGTRGRMSLDERRLGELAQQVDVLVLDESTRAGGDSLTNKLCHKLSWKYDVKACYALAGRPFGRDPTMLYRQQLIVDGGESLGTTLGLFREAFFVAKKNYWAKSDYSFDFAFDKRKLPKLARMMRHRSISYTADECVELPPVSYLREAVAMPPEVLDYYQRAAAKAIEEKKNYRQLKSVFIRMRQMSSGFMGFKDDDTGEKSQLEFDPNPKRERLLELLEDLPEGRKAVVFYEFTVSGKRISEELTKKGIDNIWLWSGTRDARAALKRFMTNPDCTVAVINHRVGAYSLDGLQVANYLFFYESPVSVIDREQAERRVRRDGQKHKVFQYDMIVKNTVDEKILQFHKEGADILKVLMRDPAKVLGGQGELPLVKVA